MRFLLHRYFPAFFLFLLVLFGLLVRSEGFISGNILFLYDNARDLLYVRNIVIHHHFYLIGPSSGGLQGYFHGVLWYYLLTIPFILGRGNPLVANAFMVFFSTLSILAAFFIMKKIAGVYPAILAALFFSFSVFSVSTSRFIWNPYPIVWLMPFYFASIFAFVQKKPYALLWVAFLTGLIFHFEAIYGINLLVPFLLMCLIQGKRKKMLILPAVVIFLLPMLPSLMFDLRHHFLISGSLVKTLLTGGQTITHRSDPVPFFNRIPLRFMDFFMNTLNTLTTNIFLNCAGFIVLLIGIRKSAKAERLFFLLSSVILLTPLFLFLTLKYEVWSYYWIGSAPYYALFFVYVLSKFIYKREVYIALVIMLFIIMNPFEELRTHFVNYVNPGSNDLATQLKVVKTIYTDQTGPFSVYVDTPPIYDYVYRYLFWYKGYTQYGRYPSDIKQKTVYVIVDDAKTDRDGSFFISHVLRTHNKPVVTIQYPGNVFIKKLLISSSEPPFNSNYLPVIE